MANLTIEDSGTIQSIKFGLLAEHSWTIEIYIWVILPSMSNIITTLVNKLITSFYQMVHSLMRFQLVLTRAVF
jgi:hypothetical protein